jgi:2-dehydropantoate 2-reductase
MVREIDQLAQAMGIRFEQDPVAANLAILDALSSGATTSMHRDVRAGRPSEIDGLLFEVVRLGRRYGVATPVYEKVAARFEAAGNSLQVRPVDIIN